MTRTATFPQVHTYRPARSTLRSADVLRVLDEAAREEVFPSIDGRGHPVDQRLHVYRGEGDRWAIVMETLRYSGPGENVYDVLHVLGNAVVGAQGAVDPALDLLPRIENWAEVVETSYPARLQAGVRTIEVRGQQLPVCAVPGERMLETLRRIAPEHRSLLLGTDEELRARLDEGLVEVLTLDEWYHPDIARGEMPSSSETFRQIAAVVATGSSVCYRPTSAANTHWSQWMGSEIAELPSAFIPAAREAVLTSTQQGFTGEVIPLQQEAVESRSGVAGELGAAHTSAAIAPRAALDPYPTEGRAGTSRVRVRPRSEWAHTSR